METENLIKRLLQQLEQELPFVVYRKPVETGAKAPSMVKALLQRDWKKHVVKTYSESGFVLAPFDSRKETILIPSIHSDRFKMSPSAFLEAASTQSAHLSANVKEATKSMEKESSEREMNASMREAHLRLVTKGVEVLNDTPLEKVVLSRREEVPVSQTPIQLFSALLEAYPTAFVYCWYHPKIGLWLGATPETLVHLKGKEYQTMAFAATQLYKGSMLVKWGHKELQEQQYVTDSILENLRELGLNPEIQSYSGEERVGNNGTYTSRAGNLLHLRTDIKGKLDTEEELSNIVRALHPTPAVGGLPKKEARDFILKEEPYDREYYTGFLGELNLQEHQRRARNRRNVENLAYGTVRKHSALYVNLRCMKIEGQKAMIFVGGGITADSDPEAEWEETVNKSQTMKQVLQ